MIIGLIVFGGLIIYLIITTILTLIGIKFAKKKGKPGWKGGLLVAVIMYMLLFWDFIPFHIAHKYYCATEGGFTINKPLDQWKQENPGVVETLIHKRSSDYTKKGNKERYQLNQRFVWDIYTTQHLLGIRKKDNRIVDAETSEVIAQYIDFSSGQNQLEPDDFRDIKFWIFKKSCEPDNGQLSRGKFYNFENRVFQLGSMEK